MRLYPKKINSIEDLERERKLLLERSRQLDKEEFLSLDGILGKRGKGDKESEGSSLLDLLPISNPLASLLIKRMFSALTKKDNIPPAAQYAKRTDKKPGKSIPYKIVAEFIGGYLKWKAIEWSYKGIRHLTKRRSDRQKGRY